jgi:hypothetical protein
VLSVVGRFTKVTFNSWQKISGHRFGYLQGGRLESAIRLIKFPESSETWFVEVHNTMGRRTVCENEF